MFFKIITRVIVLFLLIFSLVSIVNAEDVSFSFYKNSYSSFETVQTNVSISNITLTKDLDVSNIVLLRNDNSSISIAKNIVKVDKNLYVLYFDLPNLSDGQYTLGLINVNYLKEGSSKIGKFYSPFNIDFSLTQVISIRPAYVFSKVIGKQEAPFTLFIKNSGTDIVNVNLEKDGDFFKFDIDKLVVPIGAEKSVNVITSLFNRNEPSYNGNVRLAYGSKSYLIPFTVIKTDFIGGKEETNLSNNASVVIPKAELNYKGLNLKTLSDKPIDNLNININVGEYYPPQQVVLVNTVGGDLHSLSYSLIEGIKDMFEVSPSYTVLLSNNNSAVFIFSVNNSYKFANGKYTGFLKFNSSEGINLLIPISVSVSGAVRVTKEPVKNLTTNNVSTAVITETPTTGSNGFILWLVLLFVVILFLLVIFYFYRKVNKKKQEFEGFVEKVKNRRI